jgi:TonB family protein
MPRGNPGNWVTSNDYPAIAMRDGVEGTVAFELSIDTLGRVFGCEITSGSGSSILDQNTCELLVRRARFFPAQDGKGKFVPGSYRSRVRWQIPESPVPTDPFRGADGRFKPTTITYSFFVERDGSTSDCVVSIDDTIETKLMPVGACVPPVPYAPFVDAKGEPVRQRVSVTISSQVGDQAN